MGKVQLVTSTMARQILSGAPHMILENLAARSFVYDKSWVSGYLFMSNCPLGFNRY